jgi:hypothetical protein
VDTSEDGEPAASAGGGKPVPGVRSGFAAGTAPTARQRTQRQLKHLILPNPINKKAKRAAEQAARRDQRGREKAQRESAAATAATTRRESLRKPAERSLPPKLIFGGVITGAPLESTLRAELGPDIPDEPDHDDSDKDESYIHREAIEPFPYNRPGWKKHIYDNLARDNRVKYRQRIEATGGDINHSLWCNAEVCHFASIGETRLIQLAPVTNFETGPTVTSYKNAGRPPIDHYEPDWVVRVDEIKLLVDAQERTAGATRWTADQIRAKVVKRYNDLPLRITHKKCNLKREKS